MIPSTEHLHNAIRSGEVYCLCCTNCARASCACYDISPPCLSAERDGEHYEGCRWAAYVAEIYKLERREEKVKAAHERSGKKFSKAHAALAKE